MKNKFLMLMLLTATTNIHASGDLETNDAVINSKAFDHLIEKSNILYAIISSPENATLSSCMQDLIKIRTLIAHIPYEEFSLYDNLTMEFHQQYDSCLDKARAVMGKENVQNEYVSQMKMNKLYKDLGIEEEMTAGYDS